MVSHDSQAVKFLHQYVKIITQQMIRKLGNAPSFEAVDFNYDVGLPIFGESMSVIQLWSQLGAIVLKFHFDHQVAAQWAAKAFDKPVDQVGEDEAKDFIRELSNLVGGTIRGDLEKYQIKSGMGFPFLASGGDEPLLREMCHPDVIFKHWKILNGNQEIIATLELRMLDSSLLNQLSSKIENELMSRQQ